ncbi:hypothetical protein SRHO_G00275400 [Serrasalmus rhombeus]
MVGDYRQRGDASAPRKRENERGIISPGGCAAAVEPPFQPSRSFCSTAQAFNISWLLSVVDQNEMLQKQKQPWCY